MEDNNEKIRKKVLKLIELNKEGTYWDFKQAHYKNNVNLLKDILSLANCKHFGDRYLIIGVCENDDGQNKFKVKGLDNDKNRKDQAKIVNFLSSLQFAGENIPNFEVTYLFFLIL